MLNRHHTGLLTTNFINFLWEDLTEEQSFLSNELQNLYDQCMQATKTDYDTEINCLMDYLLKSTHKITEIISSSEKKNLWFTR